MDGDGITNWERKENPICYGAIELYDGLVKFCEKGPTSYRITALRLVLLVEKGTILSEQNLIFGESGRLQLTRNALCILDQF